MIHIKPISQSSFKDFINSWCSCHLWNLTTLNSVPFSLTNDLPNSVDYHLLYCLDADEKNNNLTLQYDDGRYLNQEYKVKLKPKHFILFSSDIRYKIMNHSKNTFFLIKISLNKK